MSIPAIYYIPHQDDETLSMAVDILRHLAAGREVICVLYTDGTGSAVQNILNGQQYSNYWGGYHNPAIEGYQPLTDQAFAEARNREFRSALGQLGVKPENIHIRPLNANGGVLSKNSIKALIQEYIYLYGLASHKTMSYHDTSAAHAWAGQALLELYNEGATSDARFFIARSDWNLNRPGSIYTATEAEKVKIKRAARCYEAWNPAAGSFAIGYHSVASQFNQMLVNPQNKIHKPGQ